MHAFLSAVLVVLGTTVITSPAKSTEAPVVIGVPNWPSAQVTAHIIGDVLETRFNLKTSRQPMGTLGIFAGIERGDVHIHPEIWLPNLESVVAKRGGDQGLLRLSGNGVAASQNVCVTRETANSTGIKRLSDLTNPEIAGKFDSNRDGKGEIWIGAQTWSSTLIERVRAKTYGYDQTMQLLEMQEDIAMASVDAAIAVGRPIVFYCYRPHHIFQLHDIVVLEEDAHDPETWDIKLPSEDANWFQNSRAGTAWDASHFHIGYASSLLESAPEAGDFLANVAFTPDDIVSMSYQMMVERKPAEDIASQWIMDNRDRIEEWTK
ncbi:MAG: glycine betaine ABC transporter substrate-binding protein [Pseudomonadota bacterium]